ncbi:MAG TPA: helix-turn-helix domain-containing protein, partial [Balneolaceae bacterium]|nr:helix-turn-helix domain-containing protein [Balneolaceae bacterium]
GIMKYFLRNAKKFLDLNWTDKIYKKSDLKHKELAKTLGFPKYRSSLRMCHRNFGMTINRFFIHCRAAEIKQVLAEPENREIEIKEVMDKLGYVHRNKFNRHFRLVTNITPQKFRFFHIHFVETTGQTLAEYEQPDFERYQPEGGKPTHLSNFLNKQFKKVIENEKEF